MVLFRKLLDIFNKNSPHEEFLDIYSRLNDLASKIKKEAKLLREMQKKIVERRKKRPGSRATGAIGLSKTEVIEEELVPKLHKIAKKTEDRFIRATERAKEELPIREEKEEMKKIIDLLEKIKKFTKTPDLSNLNEKKQLEQIDKRLREIHDLLKKTHEAEIYDKDLIRKVEKNEIGPIIKKVFKKAKPSNNFSVPITKKELIKIFKESKKINKAQDEDWRIIWRKWWQDTPKFEVDLRTPIKKPHVNVTFVLNGKKKSLHLLKAG